MAATSWNPSDSPTPKALVPHRQMAARALIAMLQLEQVVDTAEECNAAFRWLCEMPMDDLTKHTLELEAVAQRLGKPSFASELMKQVGGQGSFDLGKKVA